MNYRSLCSLGFAVFFSIGTALFSGCAINQRVVSAPVGTSIDTVYIEYNPAVLMDGLVGEIEAQVAATGFTAKIYKGERPKEAVHYLKYTANWKWDMAMYLTYFQATLLEDGRVLGTASYDARKGGINMGKFGHTGEIIRPILTELFKNVRHAKLGAASMGPAPLTGSAMPPPVTSSQLNTVTPLTGLAPLPVRCSAEVWTRVEAFKLMGVTTKFPSGEVFAAAFNGTKADQPVIDIVESSLTGKITDLGFTALLTYKVTIALTANGVRHELKAQATHAEHGFNSPATQARMVVDAAVADLYRQVQALQSPGLLKNG